MKVYITVEMYGGCFQGAHVYRTREEAEQVLKDWEEEQGIEAEDDRQVKMDKGIEFHIDEDTLGP